MDSQAELRRDAITYVEGVVARAEGAPLPEPAAAESGGGRGGLVPGFAKRFVVRSLI